MPLISINLRDPGGLMSHMNYITTHVGRSLKDQVHSDLVFVCRCVLRHELNYFSVVFCQVTKTSLAGLEL